MLLHLTYIARNGLWQPTDRKRRWLGFRMDVPEDCLRLVSRIPKNNMCTSQETSKELILGIGTADQSEFKAGIVTAIFRTMKLVFERRETDLTADASVLPYRCFTAAGGVGRLYGSKGLLNKLATVRLILSSTSGGLSRIRKAQSVAAFVKV